MQRGGGTDTLESALLHSAKSQGHGRLLYFCKAAEAEINFLKGEDKERHIAAHTVLLQNAKDTSRRRSAHLNELSNLVLRGAKPSTVENEAKASGLVGEQAKEAVKLTRKIVDGVELAVNLLSSTTESKVHTPMSSTRFQPHNNTAYVDHMEETQYDCCGSEGRFLKPKLKEHCRPLETSSLHLRMHLCAGETFWTACASLKKLQVWDS